MFLIIKKTYFFITTQLTKFMKLLEYNIDFQSFKNVCISELNKLQYILK